MSADDELLAIEARFWTEDSDFYRERLSADFLMMFPGAGVLAREAAIEGIESGSRWEAVEIREPRVLHLCEGSAVLCYSASARRAGEESRYAALVSSAYVRREGEWKLAFHHQTPVGESL